MQRLYDLISQNQGWVLDRVIDYAKEYDYTRYTSTLVDAWKVSIDGLSQSILEGIKAPGSIPRPGPDDQFSSAPIDQFSRQEVQSHRARGVTLGMFLGLAKYYRRSYLALIRQAELTPEQKRDYLDFLERFFDRLEIGYSVEWNRLCPEEELAELRASNRWMTNEKNKYLTIFETLYDPVILLSPGNHIENINQAASELFAEHSLRGSRYYDQYPVAEVFPWLANEVAEFTAATSQEVVFNKLIQMPKGERYFQVKMKRMQDCSGKYRGVVLILNDLTERKKKEDALILNRAIEEWVKTLVDIGQRISVMDETDSCLLSVVQAAQRLLKTRFAALGLWDSAKRHFVVNYLVDAEGAHSTEGGIYPCMEDQSVGETAQGCCCLDEIGRQISNAINLSVSSEREEPEGAILSENLAFRLALPLNMEQRMIGGLWVERVEPFSPSSRVVLESLANQAVIAIKHEIVANRMQSLAALEERTRIAREMHDGLAQILGFLNLEIQSLEALVRQDRMAEVLGELQQARNRIQDAQAEVRENILSLRTTLSNEGSAIPALQEYVREFGAQTGIDVLVQNNAPSNAMLSPMAEVQLVRIVQEALTNVRRHARAAHVVVAFVAGQERFCVEVSDDGIGIDLSSPTKGYGLQTMKERACAIGGKLEIDSRPGEGTQVRLCVPLENNGRIAVLKPFLDSSLQ